MSSSENKSAEKELFNTLRQVNLVTWAMSACDTLASNATLLEGGNVRVIGRKTRTELNGRIGCLLGRAPKFPGHALRWRVDVAGNTIAVRARNLVLALAMESEQTVTAK